MISMSCRGCGYAVPPMEPRPFRCPNAGDVDVDHVLVRKIEPIDVDVFFDREPNPFIRYRRLTRAWQTAMALGMSDREFVDDVRELDPGFVETPLERRLGGIRIKDETGNVAGSHKARHLMGLMIWLRVARRIDPSMSDARLAIASCGNAALGAAVVARAAQWPLDVFVPADASPNVLARLEALGANVTRCVRQEGVAGDPAYLRFREAVDAGALPFTCQGNENGLVIEGAQTLGWEIASQLAASGTTIDRLFVQTGGGALASACIAALEEAHACGVLARMPRIHAVQTAASPLKRAWDRIAGRGVDYAIAHRSEFMWPWETPPHSIASGILDDETYDWAAVVRGMQSTGGFPIVVSEERLIEAQRLAGERVSATGSAGLAGLLELQHGGESSLVLFTGAAESR